MGDACCGSDAPSRDEPPEPDRFTQITEVRIAGLAGALFVGGLVVARAGEDGLSVACFLAAPRHRA